MSVSKTSLATIALSISLLASACQSATDNSATEDPTSTSAVTQPDPAVQEQEQIQEQAQLSSSMQTMLTNVARGYEATDGVWKGFVPNEHPVVIAVKNPDGPTAAIAFNHPAPEALGDATALPTDGLPFNSVHTIANPTDQETLDRLEGFDFHAKLGGVDSFAMVADKSGDGFFDPETKDYVATLLHELFHRYQDEGFKGSVGNQDIEGYAYDAANLEMAVLEERALTAALEATTDEDRDTAAKHFAALRMARLDADERVVLDNDQERFEGTARYIEHRLSGDGTEYTFHANNYHGDLVTDFDGQGTKETFGFGRFYASGAATLAVLDRMETENMNGRNMNGRIEAGESPAEILIAELGVDENEVADLVAEAKADYDQKKNLAADAAMAAESAATEPPVFGDGPDQGSAQGAAEGDGTVITDEEGECLIEEGFDFDRDTEITQEQYEVCLA